MLRIVFGVLLLALVGIGVWKVSTEWSGDVTDDAAHRAEVAGSAATGTEGGKSAGDVTPTAPGTETPATAATAPPATAKQP